METRAMPMPRVRMGYMMPRRAEAGTPMARRSSARVQVGAKPGWASHLLPAASRACPGVQTTKYELCSL